ncbi:MAG: glycosyltransferase family 4 protein [Bacteroidetes bacterium]|nr:glycosyltransferase family 4 protein [Bacteroidota bacterium]
MKILYLGRYNELEELTGPEKVAKRIYEQSSKENETAFAEYFFDGSQYGIIKKIFGNEVVSKVSHIYRFGFLKFFTFLFKFRPEIIHIITFERFAVLAYFYKFFTGVKIVYNVHGVAVYENNNFKNVSASLKKKDMYCESKFIKSSDALLYLSEHQLKIAKEYYKIPDEKIKFINNGIDPEFKSTEIKSDNSELPSLVFIGDSERKDKDFNFLYEILDKVKEKCNLYVVGNFNPSIYKSTVGNITIISVRKMSKDLLISFLKDKDVFISSSFYDTFSIATAECMALGLAPIVTDNTGISKLITNGENGFVVKHGDKEDLSGKINLLLENKGVRTEISIRASKIYELLNWENIFSSYNQIYKSI